MARAQKRRSFSDLQLVVPVADRVRNERLRVTHARLVEPQEYVRRGVSAHAPTAEDEGVPDVEEVWRAGASALHKTRSLLFCLFSLNFSCVCREPVTIL